MLFSLAFVEFTITPCSNDHEVQVLQNIQSTSGRTAKYIKILKGWVQVLALAQATLLALSRLDR